MGLLLLGAVVIFVIGLQTFIGRGPVSYLIRRGLKPADHLPRQPQREWPRNQRQWPWVVDYHLAYDGGGSQWKKYYRTRIGARISMWWNVAIASWGGSADLHPNQRRKVV